MMNGFEKWFMKRVIKSAVTQGYSHAKNIEALYLMVREACESEFTEDNAPTMDAFLRERFETTQWL